MNNTFNTTAALSVARLRTYTTPLPPLHSASPPAASKNAFVRSTPSRVIAPEALEQPLTTNSDGVPFESYDEAESYAAPFIYQHRNTTTYVSVTTNCE